MIRTLIFMGLIAIGILIASCFATHCVAPLTRTTRETLKLVKREVRRTIKLTTEEVKCNEVDFHVGNEIIDSLTETIRQIDTALAACRQLEKKGTKEEILLFAERTYVIIISALTNLKTLSDLYDISTCAQFETAIFFTTDSVSISPEKMDEAKKAIEPVAERIIRFFGDHPRQRLEAVIAYSGTPSEEEQNNKLARSVANLLVEQIRSNEEFIPNPELIQYSIKWVVKRDELPSPRRRKHYKPEDKRRSMVSLTWSLLPASLYAGSPDH